MLKTVSRHLTSIDAHIIRTRLEAEEIPAFINSEHYIGLDWSLALALDYIQVQVPASYLEAAEQVLDNIEQGIYQAELEAESGIEQEIKPACSKCGNHDINPVVWPGKLSLLTLFMFAMPLPYAQHLKRCQSCDYQWTAHQEQAYPLYIPMSGILMWTAIIAIIIVSISPPFEGYTIEAYDEVYLEEDDYQSLIDDSDHEPSIIITD